MPRQLLFYELVTPVVPVRHAEWSLRPDPGFGFAAGTNSVPLMTTEFAAAVADYPIVFSFDGDAVLPVAVLGIDGDRNLFVTQDGRWDAGYLPAFVRRYPFVLSTSADGQTLTLCLDEAFDGFDRKGREGERLFDDAGERTPFLSRALEFVGAYQAEHRTTAAFGAELKELDLLEPQQAQLTLNGAGPRTLTGFHCVSRVRLAALDGGVLKELAASGALEMIYLHLQSLRNFESLMRRLAARPEAAPAG